MGRNAFWETSHLAACARHRKRKKAHEAGQVSGISLVKYRDWMGVNLVVGNG